MRGISMYDSSSVSTLFSSLGSSKSTGSGLFGINLSEYASIRSGSYGKLMRSYFSMDSTKGTSKSDDSTKNTIEDLGHDHINVKRQYQDAGLRLSPMPRN